MTLMGGPIDTRRSPTKVNLLAQERGSEVPFAINVEISLRRSPAA
jgi:poly-beta-hydroxyalkanoate depolymerase